MAELVILGAGATGLGAGLVSGAPVYDRAIAPGGICSSYYTGTDGTKRHTRRSDEQDWRFEIGGGHWIFGGDPEVRAVFEKYAAFESYQRRSSVYLPAHDIHCPYPIQEHTDSLPEPLATAARRDLASRSQPPGTTMAQWLRAQFGATLNELFFEPFHRLYTGGLYTEIAPQDAYKTPAVRENTRQPGYNAEFIYPLNGLDRLFEGIASDCDVHYKRNVVSIDVRKRVVAFEFGEALRYQTLLSTLPLHDMLTLTGLDPGVPDDPYTSVLVLNAAARRGPKHPDVHWLYVPESRGGFHRVGFYDNVDERFLPRSMRGKDEVTSMYIEKAYPGGTAPSQDEIQALRNAVSGQLREWGFIGEVLFMDPTFIRTAYTWTRPGSSWRERSLALLAEHDIRQAGRFAQWKFQGIAGSFKEGMAAGRAATGLSNA